MSVFNWDHVTPHVMGTFDSFACPPFISPSVEVVVVCLHRRETLGLCVRVYVCVLVSVHECRNESLHVHMWDMKH